jgi:hypothetical protein
MTERMTMAKHDTTVLSPWSAMFLQHSSRETDQLQALNADTTGFILSKDQSELRTEAGWPKTSRCGVG